MKNNKCKTILFRVKASGVGIVNFDGKEQKNIIKYLGEEYKVRYYTPNDNDLIGKKNFYYKDGNLVIKPKVSSDCIRHALFGDGTNNPALQANENLFYSVLASKEGILRGYLHFLSLESENLSLSRKSALTITDFEQTNDSMSKLEFFANSGIKGPTSLRVKETVGDMEYEGKGFIDIEQLQFISADRVFDRMGLLPDKYENFEKGLKLNLPNYKQSTYGYYSKNRCTDKTPELGIFLNNENQISLIKHFFKLLYSTCIKKTNAYMQIDEIEYKLVYDPIEDRFNRDGDSKWIKLNSFKDIEEMNFELENFYTKEDDAQSKSLREEIEKEFKRIELENKQLKLEKQKKTKEEKEKKANEKKEIENKGKEAKEEVNEENLNPKKKTSKNKKA